MSDVTIDQLRIEVEASAKTASTGIDALSASLTKLRNATKGSLGLTTTANQLSKLNTILAGVSRANAGKLSDFGYALQKLQNVGSIKISSTIGTQIQKIGEAVSGLALVDFTKITDLSTALQPLSMLGKSNLTSFINQLRKIPEVVQKLKDINMAELTSQIQALATAMQPLADNMAKIAAGFKSFPGRIQTLIKSNSKLTTSNRRVSTSYVNLTAKLVLAATAIRSIVRVVGTMITKSNEYIENINLFTVSMGKYAEEAAAYAEKVGELVGVDPGEFMRNQGIFNTIISGFGSVEDRAYLMSKNLTQLGYDIASFYNISFEDAMTKLQSGISGELEPLRRLGYDLSVARLQQEAYALGIDKTITSMTQAEKAELRYYAIMTQVTDAQGDMARTIDAPANQLRVLQAQITQCSRAWGNLFIPVLNKVLPYIIAVARVLRMLADVIAGLLGISLPTVEFKEDLISASSAAVDLSDDIGDAGNGLDKAAKKAKEVKNALLGIDELNIISPPDDSDGASASAGGPGLGDDIFGNGFDFELPEYDFLQGLTNRIQDIIDQFKKWLGLDKEISSWADFMKTRLFDILSTVGAIGVGLAGWKVIKLLNDLGLLSLGLKQIAGLALTVGGAFAYISEYWNAWQNGMDLDNTVALLASMAAIIGGLTLTFGGLGGAIGAVVTGVGLLVLAVKDALADKLNEFNFVGMIIGALSSTLGSRVIAAKIAPLLVEAFDPILFMQIGESGAAALGAGIAGGVVAAIAGITLYFTGIWDAIKEGLNWLNGMLIGAGATIAGAGIGAIIGALGGPITAGVGALIGLAVGLVTDGIIAIVQNWEDIEKWWKNTAVPFLKSIPGYIKQTVDGVITWVSELPGKIGYALGYALGTVTKWGYDLGVKVREFIPGLIESIRVWFEELPYKIGSALLKAIPVIKNWVSDIISTLKKEVPIILENLVNLFLNWPEILFSIGVDLISGLIEGIKSTLSTLITAITDFCSSFVDGFKSALGVASPSVIFMEIGVYLIQGLIQGVQSQFEIIKTMFVGLANSVVAWFTGEGDLSIVTKFANIALNIVTAFVNKLQGSIGLVSNVISTWAKDIKDRFTGKSYGGINAETFANYGLAIINGFKDKVSESYSTALTVMSTFANEVKAWFEKPDGNKTLVESFLEIGKNIIQGFIDGVNELWDEAIEHIKDFGSDIIDAAKGAFDENSPSKVFLEIGAYLIEGFDNGIEKMVPESVSTMNNWLDAVNDFAPEPTVSFAVDTSAFDYYDSKDIIGSVSADVQSHASVTATGFKEGMQEFYAEYLQPTMNQIAEDTRRQADKNETTTVQIGNRTVRDAVVTQQAANGYRFA